LTTQTSPAQTFDALGVPAALSAVLADRGITVPTPIQTATLPDSFAGRDVLGRGRTGSGKTYAFLLPVVARLSDGERAAARRPRALIHAALQPLADRPALPLSPSSAASGSTRRSSGCARVPTWSSRAPAGSRT
jgi:superfamily II DNA/RNA helicase